MQLNTTTGKRPNDAPPNGQPDPKRPAYANHFSELYNTDLTLLQVNQHLNAWEFTKALQLLDGELLKATGQPARIALIERIIECLSLDDNLVEVAGHIPAMETYVAEYAKTKHAAALYFGLGKMHLRVFEKYKTLHNFNQAEHCLEKAAALDPNAKVDLALFELHKDRKLRDFIKV